MLACEVASRFEELERYEADWDMRAPKLARLPRRQVTVAATCARPQPDQRTATASWSGVKLSKSGHAGHRRGLRRLDREVDHDHFVAVL
jgi:hypothetical protein